MSSPKNFALAALALVAIGAGVLAWNQQLELHPLRTLAAQGGDREQLNRRALAAEQRAKELADALAASDEKLNEAKAAMAKAEAPKRAEDAAAAGPNIRTMMSSAANMMNRPEVQRMMALNQKAALDTNYAKLFKQLNLAPEKLEQFKKLMVERQTVGSDVFAAAMQQGLDPMQSRREIARLTADAQAKVDGEIKSMLGDTDYASYQGYQTTLPQRSVVNQLSQSLSYTQNPLTETQAEQLVQILAQNPVARPAGSSAGGAVEVNRTVVIAGSGGGGANFVSAVGPAGPMGMGAAPISDAAVAASRPVLTDPQFEALQQMQQQQAQMRSMMQSMGGQPGQGGAGIIQFHSTTTSSGTLPQENPPAAAKPPGGE